MSAPEPASAAEPRERASLLSPSTLLAVVVGSFLALVAAMSLGWPLVVDSAKMRFGAWLVLEGMAPYREVLEVNLPGTFLLNLALLQISSADWWFRAADLATLGLCLASVWLLARPVGRARAAPVLLLAGYHLLGLGLYGTLQRDLVVAAMAGLAAVWTLAWRESPRPWRLVAAGLVLGVAATIKVHALIFALPLGALVLARQRRQLPWPVLSVLLPLGAALAWVGWHQALGELWWVLTEVIPHYNGWSYQPFTDQWLGWLFWVSGAASMPAMARLVLGGLVGLGAGALVLWRPGRRALLWALALCALAYLFVQGKGFGHHLLPTLVFLPALVLEALPERGRPWLGAVLALWFPVAFFLPEEEAARVYSPEDNQRSLAEDLRSAGPGASVLAFEFVDDLDDALLREDMVPVMGLVYDIFVFEAEPSPVRDRYRALVMEGIQDQPPDLILVSRSLELREDPWHKLSTWPQLVVWLEQGYCPPADRGTYRLYQSRSVAVPCP